MENIAKKARAFARAKQRRIGVPSAGSRLGRLTGHKAGRLALLAGGALLAPAAAMAAGTDTGVEAGFSDITDTMTTLLTGAGGYLVLIISIIVAAVTLMATGRWTYVITALAVSLFLGYGLNIVSSIGGVTASVDMVAEAPDAPAPQPDSAS